MQRNANVLAAGTIGCAAVIAAVAGAGAIGTAAIATAVAFALIRRTQRQATASLARRDEQLAHTAHELRTPLASVLTAIELLRSGYATTAAETDEFLSEADLAARHLAFLVNDVLDDAALSAGQLRLTVADHFMTVLLDEGLRLLGLQAERRGLTIEVAPSDPTLVVRADARRVLQVLFNLLGNAIKYSTTGQPIEVRVEPNGSRVRCRILDRGPGVPHELRPHLFGAFHRGSGHDGPSTGLGLFITKRLVERMGGSIGYQPLSPRGSEFWFELPRADPVEGHVGNAAIASDPAPAR